MDLFPTIQDILDHYKVKSYKETNDGLIAIRKGGFWLYFRYGNGVYAQTGSTLKYEKG
jgi:hypothetical protein